jgi:shikimate kinase
MELPHLDLDDVIESTYGQTTMQLFDTRGEVGFRALESETLGGVIDRHQDVVLSLGGGAPCSDANLALIRSAGTTVYLKLPEAELVRRLSDDVERGSHRPLLRGVDDLEAFVQTKMRERSRYYLQAEVVIDPRFITPTVFQSSR